MSEQPLDGRFEIETMRIDTGIELRLRGELDADTRAAFIAAVDERGDGDVRIDAAGVTFLDSSGLAALVIAADRTRRDGGDIRIVAMSDVVRGLLARTGLLEHLAGQSDGA